MNFRKYAQYYDSLYSHKNSETEADYYWSLLNTTKKDLNVLEIGCGTGRHAEYWNTKCELTCVEKSPEMAKIATERLGMDIIIGNAENISFNSNCFNACMCVFHVVNYFVDNQRIDEFFANISNALKPGGKLIFDFWHTPGVYAINPSSRTLSANIDNYRVSRTSTPQIDLMKNIIEVNFHFEIVESATNTVIDEITEIHNMRPFCIPEIQVWLEKYNFSILEVHNNMTKNKPTLDQWDLVVVAEKQHD